MTARRPRLWAFFELFALVGFVVAQPMLDVLGKAPDFFLFRQAGRAEILALVLWLAELAAGLAGEWARGITHLLLVAGLLAVLALEVGKSLTPVRGPGLAALGVAGGLLGGLAYATRPGLTLWLRYLAPAPLVFAMVFLLVSPVSKLVLPQPGGVAAASPGGRVTPEHPVVVLLLDEFPLSSLLDHTGHIDRRVYPSFAELAGQSTWYRNATGISGYTPWAMPAMLTGRYPAEARAPSYTEYPDNLLTLFGRSYDLKVYETISQLCPPSRCPETAGGLGRAGLRAVIGDSARVYKDIVSPYDVAVDPASFIDETAAEEIAPKDGKPLDPQFRFNQLRLNQPSRFNDFLAGLKDSRRPTLHFLHLLLPDQPWRYLPSGAGYNYKPPSNPSRPRPRWSSWPTSATCSRSPTPTGWSARSSTSSRPRACGTSRWWSWGPATAPAGSRARSRAAWARPTSPTCCGCPSSSRPPARTPGSSTTATGSRSTCCRPSPTWSPSPCPGRPRAAPRPASRPGPGPRSGGTTSPAAARSATAPPTEPRSWPARPTPWSGARRASAACTATALGRPALPRPDHGRPDRPGPTGNRCSGGLRVVWADRARLGADPGPGRGPADLAPPPKASTVLVAVDGKIAGESKLFPNRPGEPAARFAVITPDFLWRAGDGRRQLQLYVVDRSGGAPRLVPVSLSSG